MDRLGTAFCGKTAYNDADAVPELDFVTVALTGGQ
jgi:hypothetical protein